jgi:LacI family transcriptional regulator
MTTMPESSRATRADVARYAGVSPAVVSYVLNDGPRNVASATRERVLNAVSVLGYRPNPIARALKTESTRTIGLLIPDIANPLFAELANRIEEEADLKGLGVLLTTSRGESATEREQVRTLIDRRVDGLIILSASSDPDVTQARSSPVVVLDRAEAIPGVNTVGVDYEAATVRGVDHLIWHGHTRIGFIGGSDGSSTTQARERGWLAALRNHQLPEGPSVRTEYTRRGGYEAARRILALDVPPTAIFVASDLHAVGVMHAFNELGVQVPHEIAVVNFDGSIESEYTWPPLTVMRQPLEAIAESAVAGLAAGIGPSHTVQPAELIIRQSCGC